MAFEVVDIKSPFQIQVGVEKDEAAAQAAKAEAAYKLAQVDEYKRKTESENAFMSAEAARLASAKGGSANPFANAIAPNASGIGYEGPLAKKEPSTNLAYNGEDGPAVSLDPKLDLGVVAKSMQTAQSAEHQAVQAAFARYQDAEGQYKSAASSRNFKMLEESKKASNAALKDLAAAQDAASKQAIADIKGFQTMLGSVKDENGLVDVINAAAATHGADAITKALLSSGLIVADEKDPNKARIVFNPLAISNLQESLLTSEQQVLKADRDFKNWFEQRKEARRIAEKDREENRLERSLSLQREQFVLDRDVKTPELIAARKFEEGQSINRSLQSSGVVKDFDTMDANKKSMDAMMAKVIKVDPKTGARTFDKNAYSSLGLPQQQALIDFFAQARENFNRHGSQIYTDKQIAEMNGRFRNAVLSVSTWGSETPKMDTQTMREIYNAYEDMHSAMNAVAVEKSLSAVERAVKAGAKVEPIEFKGSVARAVQTGQAQLKMDDAGNRWVYFPSKDIAYKLEKGVSDAY